jgi:uncharacterized membrane protein
MPLTRRTSVLVQFALFSALIILMAFTPVGYLRFGAIEATLLMIPVALGAIRLGPTAGGLLGALFGLTSFAQCFGTSIFGTTLLGIDPLATFAVCMLPRIAMGVLVAVIYRALAPKKAQPTEKIDARTTGAMAVAFLASALLNTLFFVALLIALFGSSDYIHDLRGTLPLLTFVALFVGANGLVEAIAATVGGTFVGTALDRAGFI